MKTENKWEYSKQNENEDMRKILENTTTSLMELCCCMLCWVDLGWLPGAHQATLSLLLLSWTRGRK